MFEFDDDGGYQELPQTLLGHDMSRHDILEKVSDYMRATFDASCTDWREGPSEGVWFAAYESEGHKYKVKAWWWRGKESLGIGPLEARMEVVEVVHRRIICRIEA
jgi:hypothetical protein